jgi:hypothetical protein
LQRRKPVGDWFDWARRWLPARRKHCTLTAGMARASAAALTPRQAPRTPVYDFPMEVAKLIGFVDEFLEFQNNLVSVLRQASAPRLT